MNIEKIEKVYVNVVSAAIGLLIINFLITHSRNSRHPFFLYGSICVIVFFIVLTVFFELSRVLIGIIVGFIIGMLVLAMYVFLALDPYGQFSFIVVFFPPVGAFLGFLVGIIITCNHKVSKKSKQM